MNQLLAELEEFELLEGALDADEEPAADYAGEEGGAPEDDFAEDGFAEDETGAAEGDEGELVEEGAPAEDYAEADESLLSRLKNVVKKVC